MCVIFGVQKIVNVGERYRQTSLMCVYGRTIVEPVRLHHGDWTDHQQVVI